MLELKKQHPQITLECAIPYERQAVRWPEALRNRYFSIAERCDKETMLQTHYTQDCLRNRKVGLDSAAGYLGSAIKGASLRWQRGFFFFVTSQTPLSRLTPTAPLREGSRKPLPPNAQPCLLCIKVHARNVVEFGVAPHLHWVTDWGPYGRGSVGDLAERLKTFCARRQ